MLDYVKEALSFNWGIVIIGVVLAVIIFKGLCELWDWFFRRFEIETKSMKEKRESKERLDKTTALAEQTAQNLAVLQESYTKDEKKFRDSLERHMTESEKDRRAMHQEMKKYSENRIADRKQSFQIQRELTDSIKEIAKGQEGRDLQIAALMEGSKELLGDTIDQRYYKYITLKGIPQNEVDEFDAIYNAYKGLKGNHGRQTKYEYVKNHLEVLPVKTEIINN